MHLNRNRKLIQDALIVSVKVVNCLCLAYEIQKVYECPDERSPITEFIKAVVDEHFQERKL